MLEKVQTVAKPRAGRAGGPNHGNKFFKWLKKITAVICFYCL